jgi:hypothetical protein
MQVAWREVQAGLSLLQVGLEEQVVVELRQVVGSLSIKLPQVLSTISLLQITLWQGVQGEVGNQTLDLDLEGAAVEPGPLAEEWVDQEKPQAAEVVEVVFRTGAPGEQERMGLHPVAQEQPGQLSAEAEVVEEQNLPKHPQVVEQARSPVMAALEELQIHFLSQEQDKAAEAEGETTMQVQPEALVGAEAGALVFPMSMVEMAVLELAAAEAVEREASVEWVELAEAAAEAAVKVE